MATTKQIIEALSKADPTCEMEVVFKHDDGYVYSFHEIPELKHCQEGEIIEDESPNCLVLDSI